MARSRGTDGEVWCGERLSQCCYASFGSPAFGNELTWKILRGHGAIVWSLVRSVHFYCYCGHGPVDADLSPRCWLLSSFFWWFSHLTSPASSVCHNNLQACIQLCSKVGLPLHPDKLEGPSTCWAWSCYRPGFPLKRESESLPCWVPHWSPPPVRVRSPSSPPPPPLRLERPPSHD